jgi:hypothetical protein
MRLIKPTCAPERLRWRQHRNTVIFGAQLAHNTAYELAHAIIKQISLHTRRGPAQQGMAAAGISL